MKNFYKPGFSNPDSASDSDEVIPEIYDDDVQEIIPGTLHDNDDTDSNFSLSGEGLEVFSYSDGESSDSDSDLVEQPAPKKEQKEPSGEGTSEMTAMEEDPEDKVIEKIIAESKKTRNHPPDIKVEDFVYDLCFHPYEDLLAVGTITGDVLLYKYTNLENTLVNTFEVHTKACRDINFSGDGNILYSVSKDKAIMMTDVNTGKLIKFYEKAHESAIYSICVISDNTFATGDDDGTINYWDIRQKTPVFSLKIVEDYISNMLTNNDKKLILCTSGDGYLTTVNIGSRKLHIQSEPYEEELTSMGLFRSDSKLVVGTTKGKLYSYNWGEFGLHSDEFPGPKSGINCMIPITDRIAVVGGEEGILRAMHVTPGRNLGIVGQHSLGVEALDICNNGEFIASCSHDNDIKFWNVKYFEDFDDIKYNEKHNKKRELRHNLPSSKFTNTADFFADLAE